METKPLDDRDVAPWADDGDEERAYQEEREAEREDAHFAPSEPY